MTVCRNLETACESLGNTIERIGFQTETAQAPEQPSVLCKRCAVICGRILAERALDSNGNAMNMNRNNDGQFNISNDNRDNRNPKYGLRQKFLAEPL